MRRISNSEIQTWKECRRKWWFAWYRGLRKIDDNPTGPLRSGSRVHKALEVLYVPEGIEPGNPMVELARVANEDLRAYEASCRESGWEPDPEVVKEFYKNLDLERAMVEGYLEWLEETGVDSEYEVIKSEQEVSAPANEVLNTDTLDNVQLIGKLDVRLRRIIDGKRLFMDHKTAAALVDALKGIKQNEQMLFYHILEMYEIADSDDERCVGALYNMLKKVKRTVKAKPPFFRRELIQHNDRELETFRIRVLGTITEMLQVESRLNNGFENPDDIMLYIQPTRTKDCDWKCSYVHICPMLDDGSRAEDAINDQFTVHNPMARYDTKA